MKRSVVLNYALVGALIGVLFPVSATLIRIFSSHYPLTWESAAAVQMADPLLWIIDTAPIFLGLFAALGGERQAQVLQLNQAQQEKILELHLLAEQMKEVEQGLEKHVAERTRDLQISAEISRKLSTILEPAQLVQEVVEQLQTALGYYHAHIYLFDQNQEYLVMAGGSGEVGQTLLEQGHKIARGKGLVGRAAESKVPVLVSDVSRDPNWLPNPLLPDTRSELAVPIILSGEVLGVLDVQQNQEKALTSADEGLLSSISAQISISLRNARFYEQARLQADEDALRSSISAKIQQASTVEETLQVVVRELSAATGARRASVLVDAPLRSTHSNERSRVEEVLNV